MALLYISSFLDLIQHPVCWPCNVLRLRNFLMRSVTTRKDAVGTTYRA
jgi:hypothetical protein